MGREAGIQPARSPLPRFARPNRRPQKVCASQRGLTQKEVAERTGLIQTLVSDYERGRLRLAADMIVRFAVALGISTDELLRPRVHKLQEPRKISRKVLSRLEKIESLPPYKQRALLTTIDTFLRAG